MAKYSFIELKISHTGKLINVGNLSSNDQNIIKSGDVVYIYKNSTQNILYIGQTKHFIDRHKQHFSGNEKKFNEADFDKVIILFSVYFNRSALDDVERQLITYFTADSMSSNIQYDNIILLNSTSGNSVNSYKDMDNIIYDVIIPFWSDVLYPDWVNTRTIELLKNNSLVNYSPIKKLSDKQNILIDKILNDPYCSYVINGDAGTGKTVLMTHIVAKALKKYPNKKIAIIVQSNWEKIGENIFKAYGMNSHNIKITTSTKFIKENVFFDIVIVDESHKLSRKGSKQLATFNSVYEGRFKEFNNHLSPIIELSSQTILMYDVLQCIRPANISRQEFRYITKDFKYEYLDTQFRIKAPKGKDYGSEDYINGIKYLLYKDTGLLKYTNFNPDFNRSVFSDSSIDSYFGYYTNKPLKNIIDWLEDDTNHYPGHINRVLAGLIEPWKQKDGRDPNITHFHEGNISRRWNSTQSNWIISTDNDATEQIGSVFAVQGVDLNKVGVLIGKDLTISDGRLVANPDYFYNVNGKFKVEEMKDPEKREEFNLFVLNIYYVLLTRGIDGVRIGFWNNEDFLEYMKKTLDIRP